MRPAATSVGGWLLVLCLLLLVWQPVSFGLVASSLVTGLGTRDIPFALTLAARLLATAFGVAAGLALLNRRPGAVRLSLISLAATAAVDVLVYTTPYFPSNRAPGETPLYVAVSVVYALFWSVYLARSKRVRRTFS
jgi:Protein of unknown function (DUF2569)